jgi:ferredoxin
VPLEECVVKVHIDVDRCQGHGVCHMTAPDLFQLRDEDGQAYVLNEELEPSQFEDAKRGEASCPELAITVSE